MATGKTKKPTVSPWQLKQWAAEAAQLHVSDGTSLSDAVIRVLRGKNVGIAHIKRVCEEANNQAFNILFNKGEEDRTVVFDGGPADPAIAVRELKDGFAAAPAQEAAMKTASMNKMVSVPTDQMMEKIASTEGRAASMAEARKLRSLLKKASAIWSESARKADYVYRTALDKLASEVRTAYGKGESVEDISAAVKLAMPDEFLAQVVNTDLQKKVAFYHPTDGGEIRKLANADHPLYKIAAFTYKAAHDLVKFTKAAQLSKRQYEQLVSKWPEV